MTHVKICGLKDPENLQVAVEAGARFVGFVFYPPSPRHVPLDVAKELSMQVPTGVRCVGLFVDPTDEELERVLGHVQLDMIQLHGGESAERVAEVRARFGVEVMKAIAISGQEDLERIKAYEDAADWILCDTPSVGHGGSGESFDWEILKAYAFSKPWMLAGGLTVENVGDAIEALKPDAVDVSSGVEKSRGVKDAEKIRSFISAVRAAST